MFPLRIKPIMTQVIVITYIIQDDQMPEQEGVLSAKPGIAVRDLLGCGERSRGQRADTSKGKTPSGPLLTHGGL